MKKRLMGLLLIGAFVVAGLAPGGRVHALPPQTDVTGNITDSGVPVEAADVTVKCGATTKMDTTNASGTYLVTFTALECPSGSTVNVTATKGPKSGTNSGTVVGITTKLNIGLINVDIPEYGWIGGILATGAGIGAIAYTRRRYAQQGMGV